MPAPREPPQQMPAPRAKARTQKPQRGANVLCKYPGVRGRDGYVDEIDTCIILEKKYIVCNGGSHVLKVLMYRKLRSSKTAS